MAFIRDLPDNTIQFFKDWTNLFPGSLTKNPILSHLWAAIPKNLCWQLWLARNRAIFKEQKAVPAHIAMKTIGMIAEKFTTNNISYPLQESIPDPYANWCKQYLKENSSLQSKIVSERTSHASHSLQWEIRLSTKDFQSWLRDKNSYSLFFDGASKGNPRVAGAGGILVDPRGQVEQIFAW